MNFYVATGLSNFKLAQRISRALVEDGHVLTYDWTIHGPVWREGKERCRDVSVHEIDGVRDADLLVVLFPGGRGTHVELGVALALGLDVHAWSESPSFWDITAETCAFYHHPSIHQHSGEFSVFIEALRATIKDQKGA